MTSCDEIRMHADDWVDGSLSAEARAEVEAHLAECDACRRHYRRYEQLSNQLVALGAAAESLVRTEPVARVVPLWRSAGMWRIAAAIALVLATGWLATRVRPRAPLVTANANSDGPIDSPAVSTGEVQVAVLGQTDYLKLRVPSADPHVHIVWLYESMSTTADAALDESSAAPSAVN